MRAVQISTLDGPGAVTVVDVDEPEASAEQVLIDVHAAGVTFPDLLQTRGLYQIKPPLPFVPGTEVAGVVRTAPADSGFAAGDRVVAFPGLGGFAETVAAHPVATFPLPDRLSFEQGAGIPMNVLTAHFALVHRGGLRAGDTVLVHGAAGGVGSASVQLAHALGAKVIAVVSTEQKAEFARRTGADEAVLVGGSDDVPGFKDTVKQLTGGRGVDLVVDPVGGDRFTDSLRCLAPEGKLLVIGFTAGEIPTVKVNRLLLGNISVVGVAWGEYWMRRPAYLQEQWADLLPLLADGKLDPLIGEVHPLGQASAALDNMDTRRGIGKIVLQVR
ncbi:NADPH:quinone oxidoreductase family protein [Rhodococcus sp. D2-41]|uniref:NADPH:quinone oxidoreductase family protein n=1 Tax=Speluncibacter jeojiensis TaxID=2710754 RepID=UPI00240F1F9B|nr:NADPH:quinone oxidoreductase family protein [Rhodococcus sp. D2-41]MDG3010478.1 NADPH:quinone oxidoreductase family protein [Rhodococcus sp. D2-41]